MAGKKRDLSIPWPFAPAAVKLNGDTGLLKLVAMAAMLCDHMGKMFFPQYGAMRVIGRLLHRGRLRLYPQSPQLSAPHRGAGADFPALVRGCAES